MILVFLEPDRYFSRVTDIEVMRDIVDSGFSHVLLDVDNTLLRRDTHEVPRDVRLWLVKAREAGLGICLLSNNWHKQVHDLAAELDLPIVSHADQATPTSLLDCSFKNRCEKKEYRCYWRPTHN